MKIKGIGTISKEKAMSILTREGRKAVKTGLITTEELGQMYKLDQVEKASKIGKHGETFRLSLLLPYPKKQQRIRAYLTKSPKNRK